MARTAGRRGARRRRRRLRRQCRAVRRSRPSIPTGGRFPTTSVAATPQPTTVTTPDGAPKVVQFQAPRRYWCLPAHPGQAQVTVGWSVPSATRRPSSSTAGRCTRACASSFRSPSWPAKPAGSARRSSSRAVPGAATASRSAGARRLRHLAAHHHDPEGRTMTDHGLSRRELLARSGPWPAAAMLLGAGGLGAARALGQSTPASTWPQPPQRVSSRRHLRTRLRVAEAEVPIATQTASAVVYEGMFPGPTLDIHAGRHAGRRLRQPAKQPTNLHTHGLHVSPKAPSDDVLLRSSRATRFHYRYEIPADHPGGTYWYHAHRHMLTDDQVSAGMFGMLIVRGALDALDGDRRAARAPVHDRARCEIEDGKSSTADDSSLSDAGRRSSTAATSRRWRCAPGRPALAAAEHAARSSCACSSRPRRST